MVCNALNWHTISASRKRFRRKTMNKIKEYLGLLKQTFDEWNADNAPRLAAALAYYTAFSIAPLLIVVIAVAGLAFGRDAVRDRLDEQIGGVIGAEGADVIQEIIANASQPQEGVLATIIGVVTLILGAIGVFMQLKSAINTVWGVVPSPEQTQQQSILKLLRDHVISFGLVLGIGFVLLVSLVISAVLASLDHFVSGLLPEAQFISQLINFVVSFGVVMLLFAMLFKFLPDTPVSWHDVWIGAALTSALFTIGKYLLGLYLGGSGVTSTYGAAGSFVLILLWIYYSAQILLFGAEFTQVYAQKYGSRVGVHEPKQPAVKEAKVAVGAVEPIGDAIEQRRARAIAKAVTTGQPVETSIIATPIDPIVLPPPPKDTLGTRERTAAIFGFVASLAGFVVLFVRSRLPKTSS